MAYTTNVPIIERMVSENIDKVRRARGMSAAELARLVDADPSSISRLLSGNGRLHVDMLDRAAAALDVKPGALLGTVRVELHTDGA